jgi:hypothetical protein
MLHKDYDSKGSTEKISGRGSQGTWHQDELISGEPPVVKELWLWRLSQLSFKKPACCIRVWEQRSWTEEQRESPEMAVEWLRRDGKKWIKLWEQDSVCCSDSETVINPLPGYD